MHIKTIGPKTANIMIVGEAPGAEEEKQLLPFVGASGSLLDQVLKEVGLSRYELMITNVARERPPGNNINYFFHDGAKRTQPKDFMQEWINLLAKEIKTYRPNIVIALGDIPYWTLCGQHGIMKARGYIHESTLVPGQKVLPTFHPSHVLRNWSNRFHFMLDIAKAKRNSETPEMPVDSRVHITNISLGNYLKYLKELKENFSNPIAVDIETTKTGFIDTIGIAESSQKAVSFTFCNGNQSIFSPENELKVWVALQELFETAPVIMQNGKFDLASLWAKNRVLIKNFYFDTLVAGHVIWPEAPRSLAFLTSICTNFPMWKDTAMTQPLLYNAQDCTNTYAVYEQQKEILEKNPTLMATFKEEMKQNELSAMLEIQGVYVDKVKQSLLSQDCAIKIKQLEEDLKARFNKAINVQSPKQMQALLYGTLGLPKQYQRRKNRNEAKKVTTDAKAMKKLARESKNPDLNTIMDLKKLYKLLSFIDIPLSPSSRVHTCYNITGANMSLSSGASYFIEDSEGEHKSFGRWSSSKSIIFPYGSGNLQNVPKIARKMYTVPKGFKLLQCDYKQAEAVVVAYLINDQRLIKLFEDSFGKSKKECEENGWDVHKLTGSMMFGIKLEDVTPDLRKVGKMLRHACVDKDTEVLTKKGWKKISLFDKTSDEVAQWDTDGSISFVRPIETVRYPYKGNLFEFKQNSVHQVVSPGHRVVVQNRKNKKYYVRYSEDLFGVRNADYKIPISGMYEGGSSFDEVYLRLLTATQADGSYRIRERHGAELTFHLKKERKVKRLEGLLDKTTLTYSKTKNKDGYHTFYIGGNRPENEAFFTLIAVTNKSFGSWLLNIDFYGLDAIVEETKWWDSRRNSGGNSWQYYSENRVNCEWVAIIAHLTGRKGTVSSTHPTVFTTNISEVDAVCFDKSQRNLVAYDDYIYSMQVPSTFYLIKKGDVISVTGNTNYSAGPGVLANGLSVKVAEAKNLLALYHNACPQLHIWHKEIQAELNRTRTLTNLLGREHKFMDRWGDNLFRSAYSYMPQSTVGDLLNQSLVKLYDQHGDWLTIYLQLHDAIYVVVKEEEVGKAIQAMMSCMLTPLECKGRTFTIDVDFSIGDNWGSMEEIEWMDYV